MDTPGSQDPTPEVRSLLAAIVESSDDAIISKTLSGIVTTWNKAAERIFGYSADEIIGRPVFILAAPDRIDEMPEILSRIRRGERIEHFETKRRAKNGQIIDVSLTVSPILDDQGRITGASKIARDITDKKLVEKAVAVHAERLARSNADLQQFAYVASHDLQEPLRNIAAFSELLKRRYKGQLDADADDFIDSVVSAAERMGLMIRDLLEYSRTSSAEDIISQQVDLNVALERALQNVDRALSEGGGAVQGDKLPTVRGDMVSLTMLLQNLLSNAIKYRRPECPPRITIHAKQDGGFWVISVNDNGIGIEERYFHRIFGMFKRLHGDQYPGTGIGLTLCRRILERHGGKIWVESQPAHGSTFSFTLPMD